MGGGGEEKNSNTGKNIEGNTGKKGNVSHLDAWSSGMQLSRHTGGAKNQIHQLRVICDIIQSVVNYVVFQTGFYPE